ncbi:helix-turn-helix domain-containing protein [Nocardia brasiliensis]|uniref:Helix-turn-helix domain-containing protein n=1 Tax=Nocardia brasiliensis (strain ATCC 700358 / HUJEG-1) TaxID=1133849 RepID=K0EZE1_NOCB7|nr:helix-turn-helix domain-containing protein [Nocardia brasiliensis]AFU02260.1 helix-turn-helix domain-containing protein [Nocardia brasiliensis ATCC 700358]
MSGAPFRIGGAAVEVAVPARPQVAGVSMAGFRGRAARTVELPVVPYPAVTIFLDFGDVRLIDGAGECVRGSSVIGLAPGNVRGGGREVDLLQIRLSPIVAQAISGAAAESAGAVVAFEELWGRDTARLGARLRAARSWDERFAIAEFAIARRQQEGAAVDPEVAYAWRRIVRSHGRIRVDPLAGELGWSRKRLWSRFRSQVGLTPKRAAQLVRFDHAAHRLAGGVGAARVSAECGYVDQSHLHRDAKAFAGLTPTALAAAPWLAVDPVAWAAPGYA